MLIVQKYGGATLETPVKIKNVAKRLADLKNNGHQVVAVVSAMGQTTNQLLDLSQQVSSNPLLRELDMLLSVGERISMSLVSIALNDLKQEAISLTGSQAGILTNESHINAMIIDVKAHRVTAALDDNKIVIIAGFQGVSPTTKEITTLGRGGSDTSAVAISAFLKADRCEILKDVTSIYSADPKLIKTAKPLPHLNYDILLEMTYWGSKVLHYRSVELAKLNKVKMYVGPAESDLQTQRQVGTFIEEDYMFETTKPLTVNSHQTVFEILFNTKQSEALEILKSECKNFQIGTPQILFGFFENNQTHLLVTGPKEMLELIERMCQQNSHLTLKNKNISSVSLTCTGSSLNEVLIQCEKKMDQKNIFPLYFTQSAMSLNFFIDINQKNQTIETLHELID